MIYLRKPSYYWLNHLICSTMVTELSCPFPAHITFYFAVPYLTIICHNNKLHVLHCLQSLPLVLSKNHESHILFSALIQQSCKKKNKKNSCKRKYTVSQVSSILLGFYNIQICGVFLLLMEVVLTYKTPQDLITESRRVVQSLSQPFSFLQFELSFLTGKYPL